MKKVKKLTGFITVLNDWAALLSVLAILVTVVGLILHDDAISALWIGVGIVLAINSIVTKIVYVIVTKEIIKEANRDVSL